MYDDDKKRDGSWADIRRIEALHFYRFFVGMKKRQVFGDSNPLTNKMQQDQYLLYTPKV